MGRIWNLVSVVFFLADLGTDVYLAVKHYQNGDETWFGLTLLFIVAPVITSPLVACYLRQCEDYDLKETVVSASYIQAMYQSAPQWCLQVYIMLHQWEFSPYTILSVVISLLDLTWSTITLERTTKEEHGDFLFAVIHFCHELPGFISRLVIIAVFAYVFGVWLFIACVVHSLVLVLVLCCIQFCCNEEENRPGFCDFVARIGWACIFSCVFLPFLFHPSKVVFEHLPFANPAMLKVYYGCLYSLIFAGSVIMLTLVAAVPPREVTHMDVVEPLAIGCVIGGTVLNFLVWRTCVYDVDQ